MIRLDVNKGAFMARITSDDLSGNQALTGVARKEKEEKERLQKQMEERLLENAIEHVRKEQIKAVEKDLKKKKVTKKKKSI